MLLRTSGLSSRTTALERRCQKLAESSGSTMTEPNFSRETTDRKMKVESVLVRNSGPAWDFNVYRCYPDEMYRNTNFEVLQHGPVFPRSVRDSFGFIYKLALRILLMNSLLWEY